MLYLLDTNACTDLMDKQPRICARVATIAPPDQAATCVIVRGEILYGIQRLPPGKRRAELDAKARLVLSQIPCFDMPMNVSDRYALMKAQQRQIGLSLTDNDLWIAATCAELGATLISRDLDFSRISGFVVEDWTK